MIDSSSIGTTPSPSRSYTVEDIPVHHRSIFENFQALMHDINNNHAEVVACIAAFLNSVPLIHSVLPPTEYGSLPTPPAQTPSRQVVDPADGEGTNHLHNRAPSSDNAPSSPDNAYKRAVAIAGRLPRQLGSVNVLSELQRDLQRERDRTRHSAQQEHRTPWLRSQSGEEMGNHSEILEDDDHNLQPSQRFEMAVERYWRVVIAQRYRAALQNKEKRTHSVAEEFGRKYLPDEVKRGLSKKASQDKWKRIIRQHQFWEQLAVSCGAGVLLLLPGEFQNEQWVCPLRRRRQG
ncbi:hypothetical protein NQ176_g1747 [Zarea fungicola]|uniref:Uncharacterized protein n=1 Tax=Zarea fungicola TaxID=93591 RepID=A0ACC1NSK0_9HYPO|nr:hypothetical protein NQ176_g1747 [Lecanicillium fungicola]